MITDNTAIRGHLRIGQFNSEQFNKVDANGETDPTITATDALNEKRSIYNIGAGYEWRRGDSRLRGIYGGEVFYQYQGYSRDYAYGNPIVENNQAPTSTIWPGTGGTVGPNFSFARPISERGGQFHGIGARAFAGIEYFIARRICIGTEFGMSLMTGSSSKTVRTIEYWDSETSLVGTREIKSPGGSDLIVDTDNFNGALYLMFYF